MSATPRCRLRPGRVDGGLREPDRPRPGGRQRPGPLRGLPARRDGRPGRPSGRSPAGTWRRSAASGSAGVGSRSSNSSKSRTRTSATATIRVASDATPGFREVRLDGTTGLSNLVDDPGRSAGPGPRGRAERRAGPGPGGGGGLGHRRRAQAARPRPFPDQGDARPAGDARPRGPAGRHVDLAGRDGLLDHRAARSPRGASMRGGDGDCRLTVVLPPNGPAWSRSATTSTAATTWRGTGSGSTPRRSRPACSRWAARRGGDRGRTLGGNLARPLRKSIFLPDDPGSFVPTGRLRGPRRPGRQPRPAGRRRRPGDSSNPRARRPAGRRRGLLGRDDQRPDRRARRGRFLSDLEGQGGGQDPGPGRGRLARLVARLGPGDPRREGGDPGRERRFEDLLPPRSAPEPSASRASPSSRRTARSTTRSRPTAP